MLLQRCRNRHGIQSSPDRLLIADLIALTSLRLILQPSPFIRLQRVRSEPQSVAIGRRLHVESVPTQAKYARLRRANLYAYKHAYFLFESTLSSIAASTGCSWRHL